MFHLRPLKHEPVFIHLLSGQSQPELTPPRTPKARSPLKSAVRREERQKTKNGPAGWLDATPLALLESVVGLGRVERGAAAASETARAAGPQAGAGGGAAERVPTPAPLAPRRRTRGGGRTTDAR